MSTKTSWHRMEEIFKKRGRIPVKATHEMRHEKLTRKSKAGVEYTHYKPIILSKNV